MRGKEGSDVKSGQEESIPFPLGFNGVSQED